MPLDIDGPINRAVVVESAISATRNYLKLHMSRTLKGTLVQYSCQNAEVVEASCRVAASQSKTRRSLLPSRAAPVLNPRIARCLAGAQLPATSCLGAFWTPASLARGSFIVAGVQKPAQNA